MRYKLFHPYCHCKCLFIVSLLGGMLVYTHIKPDLRNWNQFYFTSDGHDILVNGGHFSACPNVIDKLIRGHWSYRQYTKGELNEMEAIVRRQRDFHRIPHSLQRSDGQCGNINYEDLGWFRALCNPKGVTPCCFNNTCVNKTVQECQCTECYDFRQKVYAELADWTPDDPSCKILQFKTKDQVCDVLRNVTFFFIGDSFVRQLYISVLGLFEANNSLNIFLDQTSPENVKKCDKHYRYIAECRYFIKHEMLECNNKTRLYCEEIYRAEHALKVLQAIEKIKGMKNSWLIVGFGAHDNYNVDHVKTKLLEPLLEKVAKLDWPKLLWLEPQAAGLLKTHRVPQQLNPYRINYNLKVNDLMTKHNVPVLRFYNMTSLALSYDGSHYGKGVNDVKAQILLNYILEQRSKLNI